MILGAILSDSWFILLGQGVVGPILNIINIPGCLKKMKMNSLRKKLAQGEVKDKIQEEVQLIFEKHEFDPSFAYAAMANCVFTAFFFQPLLPFGSACAFLGLFLNYYAYKKMLLKDSKRPVMVSDDIAEVTLYLLNAAPFVYGVASLHPAFIGHLRQNAQVQDRRPVRRHARAGNHQYYLPVLFVVLEYL